MEQYCNKRQLALQKLYHVYTKVVTIVRPSLKIKALHRLPLVSEVPQSIHPFQLSPKKPEIFWRNVFLPFYINRHKTDVVHFPWNGNVPPFINKTRVITTIHDVLPLEIPGYFLTSDEKR